MSNPTTNNIEDTSSYLLNDLIDLSVIKILQDNKKDLGTVTDFVARFDSEGYPPITGLLMVSMSQEYFIPIRYVTDINYDGIILSYDSPEAYESFLRRPKEALLAKDILNHKLIHISEKHHPSLVKADDLQISHTADIWFLSSVIQFRSGKIKSILRLKHSNSDDHNKIDFLNVEPFMNHVPTSLLKLRHKKLAEIHPSELADLVESANPAESEEILDAVGEDIELEADVIEELNEDHQLHIVSKRSNEEIAELLSNMEPDDAADLIGELNQERRDPVLKLIPTTKQQDLRKLLGYNAETAGGLMNSEIVTVNKEKTVSDLLEILKISKQSPTILDTIFAITKEGTLAGHLRIAELVKLDPADSIDSTFHHDTPSIFTGADFPEVVTLMSDFNLYSLAVVDEDNKLVGAITVDDILDKLVPDNWRKRALVDRQ
jgi:CBS domain-containing protein